MMNLSKVLLLLFLISPIIILGQTDFIQKKTLTTNDSLGIQVIKMGDTLQTNYFLIYNDVDSILFHSENYSFNDNLAEFDGITIEKPIQLDNIGNKEIILYHVHNNFPKEGIYNKMLFVINLDTKQKIFQGKYYHDNGTRSSEECYTYSYDISFDAKKNIIIDYLDRYSCLESDQKEGIYTLIDGKYTWVKSQYEYTKKTIARNDSLGIQVFRISNCEKNRNNYLLVFNEKDSISFHGFGNRCIEQDPLDFKENFTIKSIQLDKTGNAEIILEYEYSGDMNYTGYNKSIIIFNTDSLEIIFRAKIEARGRYFYGEEWGDLFSYKYDLSITDARNITILKKSKDSGGLMEGTYTIIDGKYILQKEK